ncbi:hypothetical protein OKA06_08125 [Novosphingobium sp. MW5]|nr:hypothetical protein [Novosphingobium sp. MW5]
MRFHWAILVAALLTASPARAERLQFDHRLYPPLQQVLDSGNKDMIDFNSKNPTRLVDLIAVKGKSAKAWSEALEIVSIVRPGDVSGAQDWMALMQKQSLGRCKAEFSVIAQDANSVTFERHSRDCRAERANHGLYRLVAGKRSWFQLSVLSKGELAAEARTQWLALLASARLE